MNEKRCIFVSFSSFDICEMAVKQSCTVPVHVLYGPYDYSQDGDKFKVWRQDDLESLNLQLNSSCTEPQKKDIGLKIYSTTPLQRDVFLQWCKFVNSDHGRQWKETFLLSLKEYCDHVRNIRAVAKHDLGINRDQDVELAEAHRYDAMESDVYLNRLLEYLDIVQFAVSSDEWILAVIALQHLTFEQFARLIVYLMSNKYKASTMVFFQQYDESGKQKNLLSVTDLLFSTHEKFWRSFHPFLPYVFNQLCTTQLSLEEIERGYEYLTTFSNTCLIWSSSIRKAKERWGTEAYLDQKLVSYPHRC